MPDRLVVRLTPDDELRLRFLLRSTSARNKADVVRHALATLKHCCLSKLQSDRLEIRSSSGGRIEHIFLLEPQVSTRVSAVRATRYAYVLQLRLTPYDRDLLAWLGQYGPGQTRSANVRASINVLYDLSNYHARGLELCARIGDDIATVDLPLLQQARAVAPTPEQNRLGPPEARDLLRLVQGQRLDTEELKQLHTDYPWKSVLVKIDTLYDDASFLRVVQKHLRHGAKLFYVIRSSTALMPLQKRLQASEERLDLKWRQFVRALLIDDPREYEELDDFVVFNFLEESDVMGYIWYPTEQIGMIARRDELETFARRFIHSAQELEHLDERVLQELPSDKPLAAVVSL